MFVPAVLALASQLRAHAQWDQLTLHRWR